MSTLARTHFQELPDAGPARRDRLVELLQLEDATALYQQADRVRAEHVGDEVHLRALVEFSNHCRRNCTYCGLRRDHRGLARYRMSPDEIVRVSLAAAELGYRTVVLQSGEDPWYTASMLARVVSEIKSRAEVAVTLSIGERSEHTYRLLRQAGADRFLLRIETSSPDFYRQLHPDSDWDKRRECLRSLRECGFQVGSGVMIGLPGQTPEMLADDLLFLQSLDLDMIGVGPFLPHPATPLAHSSGGKLDPSLRFLACLRLLCPVALIPATTALAALDPEGWLLGMRAGADVIMPNVTPMQYRRQYDLYPGKVWYDLEPAEFRRFAEEMIARSGRRVARDLGHSRRRSEAEVGPAQART